MGEHQVLSEAEQAAVRQAVLDHIPSDLGLSGQLWTRGQIGELVFTLYRVRFTEPGVGKYLKRGGAELPASGQAGGRAGRGSGPRLA